MDEQLLQRYAAFAVNAAVNIQPGEVLIIRATLESAPFARLCAEAAYNAGAGDVVLHYTDEAFSRLRMQHTDASVLEDAKPWELARFMDYYKGDNSVCVLRIASNDPEIYKGLDAEKIQKASQALTNRMRPWMNLTMANKVRWGIVAIPGRAWAQKVFPGENADDAVQKMWDAIFRASRMDEADPVAAWKKHSEALRGYASWLQGLNLAALHLTAGGGTDLTIGLADTHIWQGGGDIGPGGVPFLPNVPTEEVFTAPHRLRTDGVVKTSLPYVYNGDLIEGITVRFEQGKIVEYSAEKGGELLQQMLHTDEGALHIGEIALVPASSPIRRAGVLFYNTLLDENAACHIAFGDGYPGTIRGGDEMPQAGREALGLNHSNIHEDVMIGTPDMNITGITQNDEKVPVFVSGEWAR